MSWAVSFDLCTRTQTFLRASPSISEFSAVIHAAFIGLRSMCPLCLGSCMPRVYPGGACGSSSSSSARECKDRGLCSDVSSALAGCASAVKRVPPEYAARAARAAAVPEEAEGTCTPRSAQVLAEGCWVRIAVSKLKSAPCARPRLRSRLLGYS